MKWILAAFLALLVGCAQQHAEPSIQPQPSPPSEQKPGPPIKPSVRREHPLESLRRVTLLIGAERVDLYVADNDSTRNEGLMFVSDDELEENHGMIFVFEREEPLSFWMRNTIIPLDIAYLDKSGRILNILTMRPLDVDTKYASEGPAQYAIEMKAGWFENKGIGAGERIDLGALH